MANDKAEKCFSFKNVHPIKKLKEMLNEFMYNGVDGYMENGIYNTNDSAEATKVLISVDNRIHHTYEEIENIRNGTLYMLGLSEMSYNCMKAAGKNTVRDILSMTEEELEALKATNTSCYDDIVYKVNLRRLEFDYEKRNK